MTIEEFVSAEHNGSGAGAAKGCGYNHIFKDKYEGAGYDCFTVYNSGYSCSDAERKGLGFGEANGMGNKFGVGHGGTQTIKY